MASDVLMGRRFHRPTTLPELLTNALDMALANPGREKRAQVDLLITPDTTEWGRVEVEDVPALVREGYRAAREALEGWGGFGG